MSERERWLPTDDEIHLHLIHKGGIRFISDYCRIVRDLLRATVERALAEQEVTVRRATLEEAARAVCERCAVETPALGDDGSYWHSPGNYGSTWCDASPIYELIAALGKEAKGE